jgi:hypothetical protein
MIVSRDGVWMVFLLEKCHGATTNLPGMESSLEGVWHYEDYLRSL